jgi:hypothetical protein
MSLLELEIDQDGLEQTAAAMAATGPDVEKALGRTLRKMALWLRARSVRGLSAELKIQQKIVRRRLKTFKLTRKGENQAITVWYGLDPIAFIYLGTPKKTATGVRVGNFEIPGGFVARGANGNLQVFKRIGSARLPLAKQSLDVQDDAQTYIEDRLLGAGDFEAQFFTIFDRELRWQTKTQA